MADYQVLARKYRPQKFKEVIGQEAIVQTLRNALISKKTAHAYLFSGPRGTGKTTLARLLAKALNCENPEGFEPCTQCTSCKEIATGSSIDVLEIDGASHRGIDDIRVIADSVGYAPSSGRYKVYIIDEVHMLTKEAFNALLKTLEEPPSNVRFFFATTEVHKVPATIVSRCQRFNLQRIPLALIVQKLSSIVQELEMSAEEEALFTIARYAGGGLRDAESLLDQIIAFSEGAVVCSLVEEVLGTIPRAWFFALDAAVTTSDILTAMKIARDVFMQGKDIGHFLEDLQAHYRTILLVQLGGSDLVEYSDEKEAVMQSCAIYTQEQCLTILEWIQNVQQSIKTALSEEIALETLLIKIVRVRLRVPLEYITRRLVALEQKLAQGPALPVSKQEPVTAEPVNTQEVAFSKNPPQQAPLVLNEQQAKVRQDTLLQFAAVELKGIIQKKRK